MSTYEKPTLLVLTSTFPRWKGDTTPPFVYELSKRLTHEFDVHVLAPSYPKTLKNEIMSEVKVHRFHYFINYFEKLAGCNGILPTLKKNKLYYLLVPFFLFGQYIAAIKLAKELKPAAIHAHWIIPQGVIALALKKRLRINYFVTSHGGDIFGLQGKFLSYIKKLVLENASHITVVSGAIKNEVKKISNNLPSIDIIPMGVDSSLFHPSNADPQIKAEHHIDGPFLLFVGRLAEKKGVQYLLKAMPDVIQKYPTAKLMIIGSGPLEKALKKLTDELQILSNTIFLGSIHNSELPKYYATADIFIGPSIRAQSGDTEGFGLTFVEAGMSGVWLIGSNVGGIGDIIVNGKNGYLINQKDPQDIADKIIYSLNSPPLKPERSLLSKYDWSTISRKYIDLFHAILSLQD